MLKHFRKKPNQENASLFERFFFNQDFQGIWQEYLDLKLSLSNLAEAEVVFACGAILGMELEKEVKYLWKNTFPSPLDANQVNAYLKKAASLELMATDKGILNQPKYIDKIVLAAAIGLQARKDVFIELGTFLGHSVRKVESSFNQVLTVEADPLIFKAARALFEVADSKIISNLGNSIDFLKNLDVIVGNQAIIFMDAHYSTGITSKEFGTCPIMEEITIILERFPKALCVIDDIRCMNGQGGYPNLTEILGLFTSSQSVLIAFDQMIFSADKTINLNIIDEILQ